MERPAPGKKAALELDKFKRRLIRAVARLLLQEKKPEEEIWTHLKKETGCDCELLWTRMRALTLKKLDRLLAANDRVDNVPKAARMSLTDWLLFDLVLVHQKIDFIGQNSKEDSPALVDLLELVKMFQIEGLSGDRLAEAWSSATLFYNNQGHQCSPMLLQRRWYQLKEVTRTRFYEFWYAYRGTAKRLSLAHPYTPSPLQTAIAKTYINLIISPFYEWEELIKRRLVTLPEEFEKKMLERSPMNTNPVRKPSQDVPDLVMIEPRIETIDLRLEPDDNENEESRQEESPQPPIVRIKEEPQDMDIDIDETQIQIPKKSIYEEVLESTDMENDKLDNMCAEEIYDDDLETEENEIEDNEEAEESIRDDEESVLPQITCVFGNVSDTSVLGNVDESSVHGNSEETGVRGNDNDTNAFCNVGDTNVCGHDKNNDDCGTAGDVNVLDNEDHTEVCDDVNNDSVHVNEKDINACDIVDDNSVRDNDRDSGVCGNDKDIEICDNVEDATGHDENTSPGGGNNISVAGDVTEIIDNNDDDASGNVGVACNVVETRLRGNVEVIGNVDEISVTGNVEDTSKLVVCDNISNKDVLNAQITNSTDKATALEDVEIIENSSHPVVITDSDEDDENIEDDLIINRSLQNTTSVENNIAQPMEVDPRPKDVEFSLTEPLKVSNVNENIVEKKPEIDVKSDPSSFTFGELPNDISFADDGIEFVDDGIAYIDEDCHSEIKSEGEEDEEKPDDTSQIDAKLLMCPIIYTSRLDDMGLTQPFDHIDDKLLLDAITKKSKPIINLPKQKNNKTNKKISLRTYSRKRVEIVSVNNSNKIIENVSVNDIIKKVENVSVNDSSNIIENISENYTIKIENIPENDSNISNASTSDDDDYDENVITESQKVKPTSCLLQKPRSRRYNPIQLCKNPDFNTRLKRLTVGFFSSPRNCILFKSCKPLTIDLSKAFESKLISGTLYLKPSDHNVKTEIIDDTESCQNVSVVPSAMPAQSLIDNSKVSDIIPQLQSRFESLKPPDDHGSTSERNRVINLPDITEIRRINQRLLTAEVTPIQIQNNQPQVPVTIVTISNTPTQPTQKTITIADTDEHLRTEATDSRGPPKILDITQDSPAKTSTEHCSAIQRNTYPAFRPLELGHTHAGRPPRMINGRRLYPQKPLPGWKPRQFRPEIPWLSRSNEAAVSSRQMEEETLLTLDTLNKMLYLLTDKEERVAAPKKPKLKRKGKNTSQQTKKQRDQPKTDDPNYILVAASNTNDNSAKQNKVCQKPKINIKSASNYPPDQKEMQNKTVDPAKPGPSENSEKNDSEQSKKEVQYCCWARQRMLQLLFCKERIPWHNCLRRQCVCCCRNLLKDFILHDQKIKNAVLPVSGQDNETLASKKTVISKSVETGVENLDEILVETPSQVSDIGTIQVPCAETVQVPEDTPVIDVEANEDEPIDIDALGTEGNVPVLGGEVSVTTTPNVPLCAPLAVRGLEIPVNVSSGRSIVSVPVVKKHNLIPCVKEVGIQPYQVTRCISSDNLTGGVLLNATTMTQTANSPSSLTKILAAKKSKALNKFKTNMPPPSQMSPLSSIPKHFKEKMIFLNSKQISEKPSDNPIFLGKNKILLTTTKFPPNLKLFEEAKKALGPSLNLPNGVHLICLPNGTISYKIDHDVEVNATDLAEIPGIIAAVRAHVDIHAAQEEALIKQKVPTKLGVTESEVVDLVDDDDDSAHNVNENNETPPVMEVKTTDDSCIINGDDDNDSRNSQTETFNEIENNRFESNIKNNFIETETENSRNESVDQNSVADIHLSQSEQVQNQPDSSSQNISAEVDDQPIPAKSTDGHEASTKQTQDKSDPPSQNENAEENDQSKLSSKAESTDEHEVLTKQTQNQTDPSSHNVSTEVENQPELSNQSESTNTQTASVEQTEDRPEPATQNVSSEVPEESTSEPNRNKTKNILSDLMEMSGIFDEDMTTAPEETVPAVPEELVEEPPVLEPASAGTPPSILQTIVMPVPLTNANAVSPVIKSPFGELTPITSMYELKYACANNGVFFKLDFETGFLAPINVCMKMIQKPPKKLPPKSVIDLTDDDDTAVTIPEQKNTKPEDSSSKRSLLLVNHSPAAGTTSPVKPIKLFKPLKPSILQRLNIEKINLEKKNITKNTEDHKQKRKQFLKNINLNVKADFPVRQYIKKDKRDFITLLKVTDEVDKEPTATTSLKEPGEEFATTILSDDSSDDEPLAKIAKKKKEKDRAPELETMEIELEPPAPHAEGAEDINISNNDNDLIEQEEPFGVDLNQNDEDVDCILGV